MYDLDLQRLRCKHEHAKVVGFNELAQTCLHQLGLFSLLFVDHTCVAFIKTLRNQRAKNKHFKWSADQLSLLALTELVSSHEQDLIGAKDSDRE